MATSSPIFATGTVMGEFGTGSGWSGAAGLGARIRGRDSARGLLNPSTSSMSNTTGSLHTIASGPTLESDSGRSTDLDYLQPGSAGEFTEVDIGGSGVVSPPPHLRKLEHQLLRGQRERWVEAEWWYRSRDRSKLRYHR